MIPLPRILDNNGNETGRLHPLSLSVNESIVPLSYASMEVANREVVPGRTWVEIFNTNGSLGVYRTRAPQENYGDSSSMLQLEHGCVEIGDWLVTDAIKGEYSVREAFEIINTFYRGSYWQLGAFVADEKVVLNLDYENVLEALLGVLEQAPQYMMVFDFSTRPWTFSIERKSETVTAEGRLSRNITSASIIRDDKDLCTRVYVNGLPRPVGREGDENAVGYMDSENISIYGIVEKKEDGGTDLTVEEATRFAQTYLSLHDHPRFTIDIDGVDLSAITNVSFDSFRLGKLFRLVVPKYNVAVQDYITAVSWPNVIKNPKQCNVTVGTDQDPTISFLSKQKTEIKRGGKRIDQLELTASYMRAALVGAIAGIFAFVENSLSETRDLIDSTAATLTGSIEGLTNFVNDAFAEVNSDLRTMGSDMNVLGSSISSLRTDVNALQEGVYNLRIIRSGDDYTLQKRNIKSDTWVDVGTFSRATSLSGSWSGARYIVTAYPQGVSEHVDIVQRITGSSSTVNAKAQFGVMNGDNFVQHGSDVNGYLVLNGTGSTAKVDLNSSSNGDGSVWARKSVATVWNNGYDDAKGKVEFPTEIASDTEVTSFIVKAPNDARDGQVTKTFNLAKGTPASSGYASVSLAGEGVVGRIAIGNWWQAGYDNARDKITYPDQAKSGAEVTSFNLLVPNAARTGKDTKTFTLAEGTPASSGFVSVSLTGVGVVGRIQVGDWYNAGWAAARNVSSLPNTGNTSSASFTASKPSSTVGEPESRTYTVSVDNSYGYIKTNVNGTNVTIARVSHSAYTNGWTACYNTLDTSGTTATKTLNYDEQAVVSVKLTNSSGSVISRLSRTYTAPSDRYSTGYSDGRDDGVAIAGGSAWFHYASSQGSNHQGTLDGNKYVSIGYKDASGNMIWKDNTTWLTPNNSGETHSITITPDNVGHTDEPSGTELYSSTNFVRNKWYKFTVHCGSASKVYKIHATW